MIRHFMSNFILNPLLTASDFVRWNNCKRDVSVILVKVKSVLNNAFLVNALSSLALRLASGIPV